MAYYLVVSGTTIMGKGQEALERLQELVAYYKEN